MGKMTYPSRPQRRPQSPIIALLTDFGLEDGYVGVMKGVIAQINRDVRVIDLTHQVPPQNIALGSFQLGNACEHFPFGTIYVGVVDPGVGSARRAVAIQTSAGTFLGPDNGLFSHVLQGHDAIAAVELENNQYWYAEKPSNTFHGRDIFAPVAAYLASGILLREFGPSVAPSSLHILSSIHFWRPNDNGGIGNIQAIDHFGNLITNIPASHIQDYSWSLQIGQHHIPSALSYSTTRSHPALRALIGSHGWLEIALPNGSAQDFLHSSLDDSVQLIFNHQL